MSRERPLRGGCSCGRNQYTVEVPQHATEVAQVYFDSTHNHQRSQASPLSAWLRVPLSWYHSSTHAFFDDENHNTIRRVYTSPQEQSAKRHFCGFCGTPLSYWSESPVSEASYISLTLGSLTSSDLRDLEELGLLPAEALGNAEADKEAMGPVVPYAGSGILSGDGHEGLPWFDTMVEGSTLGKVKRSRGQRRTGNGRVTVEWEIIEWTDGDGDEEEAQGTGKRKLGDIEGDDALMEGQQ